MMRARPHDPPKHRWKSLSTPASPDGYALSPSVNTAVGMLPALSALTTLSMSAPVSSSPLVPHTAMSPAPMNTAAPGIGSSTGAAPGGVGVGFLSFEQESSSALLAMPTASL